MHTQNITLNSKVPSFKFETFSSVRFSDFPAKWKKTQRPFGAYEYENKAANAV